MWWLLALLLVVLAVIGVTLFVLLRRAHKQALVNVVDPADADGVNEEQQASTALMRELRPSFAHSAHRIETLVRGIDAKYGVPWYLLIGPAGAGKTTLLTGARETAFPKAKGLDDMAAANSMAWHYFEGGVVIDVAAALAFPGTRTDLSGWRALLRLIKRYRPRRPIDGVIVAIPASLLLDDGWRSHVQGVGAALRERLALAQGAFGFTLPVYVIVTQSDHVRGFTAFTDALPDHMRQDMLGWSNPYAPELVFQSHWIAEGLQALHRSLVHVQVELFAVSQQTDQASDLLLFSSEIQRISAPLRLLLEEMFRPSSFQATLSLRGFYFSGQAMHPVAGNADLSVGSPVCFVGDLLERKIFPERGLATPLAGTSVTHDRVSLAAKVAAVLLGIVLTFGTSCSYARLQRVQAQQQSFFGDVRANLELQTKANKNERSTTDEERISRGFALLEAVKQLSEESFRSPFFPASLFVPFEPTDVDVVMVAFGHLILPNLRLGLEDKGRTVFAWRGGVAEDREDKTVSPILDESAQYKALKQFAIDYRVFIDNYFRYSMLRARSTKEELPRDLTALAELGNYLTGRSVEALSIPAEPYGSALTEAEGGGPVDCGFARNTQNASLVEERATALLTAFATSWFGDANPVITSQVAFEDQWTELVKSGAIDVHQLIADLDRLAQSLSTWAAIAGRSGELRIPVLELPPYKRLDSAEVCEELRPDMSAPIEHVRRMRDALTGNLATQEAPPFGALLKHGEKGLVLSDGLRTIKTELDHLKVQDFWAALPAPGDGVLPPHASWRPEALDLAATMFESFDRYRGGAFKDLEASFRRPLMAAVTAEVAEGLATRLSQEATEHAVTLSQPADVVAEVTKIGTLMTAAARLAPLFDVRDTPFMGEVVVALNREANEALQILDQDAASRHPYVFGSQRDAALTNWTDIQSEFTAPAEAAKHWTAFVDEQRDSIHRYAMLAAPLVRFLVLSHAPTTLSRHWAAIVDDVAKSDQKLAGNGFGLFESFVRDGLPSVVPDRDCTPVSASGSGRAATGFFLTVRNEMIDAAVRRCRSLAGSSAQTRYAAIARSFNRLLAGKFPFSGSPDGVAEAQPADVAEFLRAYDRQDGHQLVQQLQTRACSGEAAIFLRRVEAVYPLLSPAREQQTAAITLDVTPEFRVNPDREIGGNQIVQWQLEVGRQTMRDGDPPKPARWISGDPVRFTLRFAKDSPERPAPGGRAVHVGDRTLQFDFEGAWALFGFVRAGRPAAADLVGIKDPAPNLLKFEIPVEPDPARPALASADRPPSAFRVFVRLRASQPGKPEALVLGDLPVEAPPALACTTLTEARP